MIGGIDKLLSHESHIVWLVPQAELPRYVRESEMLLPRRRGMSQGDRTLGYGTVVGYSELHPTAPSDDRQGFWRRVFWLKPYDPYKEGGCPAEGVASRSVVAGQRSQCEESRIVITEDACVGGKPRVAGLRLSVMGLRSRQGVNLCGAIPLTNRTAVGIGPTAAMGKTLVTMDDKHK